MGNELQRSSAITGDPAILNIVNKKGFIVISAVASIPAISTTESDLKNIIDVFVQNARCRLLV